MKMDNVQYVNPVEKKKMMKMHKNTKNIIQKSGWNNRVIFENL